MTFGTPTKIETLRNWAATESIQSEIDLLLDVLVLGDETEAIGNALKILASDEVVNMYRGWGKSSPHALILANIGCALKRYDNLSDEFPPLQANKKAKKHLSHVDKARYLAGALVGHHGPCGCA